ncbi:hypothetical protein [Pseudohoeflea coraliihabitans]|uniref:Uncharacterized protein n=1 Tax=Pseudohoeflea coraliihabitans TaxID=2860393 RepID=A0ABS6WLK6_9HYPH|nr:hypothetical protein [Pseudohoeflea sp. DP4N28-3]MBW3096847.1 hypothetical protein [Pseudohoeflea sp. DP4N28-3]
MDNIDPRTTHLIGQRLSEETAQPSRKPNIVGAVLIIAILTLGFLACVQVGLSRAEAAYQTDRRV